MKNKRGVGKWVWIVIIILIAIGAYLLLSGNGIGGVPQPPALPA